MFDAVTGAEGAAGAIADVAAQAKDALDFKNVLDTVDPNQMFLDAMALTQTGTNGNDTVNGTDGNDSVIGGQGDDLLSGGKGNDLISGDDGNDTLVAGGGNDTLKGGTGNDTAILEGAKEDYTVTTGADGAQVYTNTVTGDVVTLQDIENVEFGGAAADTPDAAPAAEGKVPDAQTEPAPAEAWTPEIPTAEPLVEPEDPEPVSTTAPTDLDPEAARQQGAMQTTISGSYASEMLRGTTNNDIVRALMGNDVLDGGAGDDLLIGGSGNDTLIGGEGVDNALFFDHSSAYNIDYLPDGTFAIEHKTTGERDILAGVEQVTFSDGNYVLSPN